ncbi:MAG: transporter ATP-binding protein [Deltaproteobacteria bacterium]|nr:transporter ATP-binding protein [Deltaproteobacteria bacterium]
MSLLEVKNLTRSFGGLTALSNVDFHVEEGEIVSLIGPNGAGKTTFFNCVTGIYSPTSGSITFRDEVIAGLRPGRVAEKGISRTFQNIRLFASMTALENVMTSREEEKATEEKGHHLLRFVGISPRANSTAGNLPYGDQRRLEIARALATEPKLLLLDEPAAGMNQHETDGLKSLISKIRNNAISILLIEHHMKVVMSISNRVVVLDHGEKLAEGTPKEIQKNPDVIKAYLGG